MATFQYNMDGSNRPPVVRRMSVAASQTIARGDVLDLSSGDVARASTATSPRGRGCGRGRHFGGVRELFRAGLYRHAHAGLAACDQRKRRHANPERDAFLRLQCQQPDKCCG